MVIKMPGITLYHGGDSAELAELKVFGLNRDKSLFLTPSKGLAGMAATHSGYRNSGILKLTIPYSVYKSAVRNGYLVEGPYAGSIPWEGATQVEVKSGDGIDFINRFIKRTYC